MHDEVVVQVVFLRKMGERRAANRLVDLASSTAGSSSGDDPGCSGSIASSAAGSGGGDEPSYRGGANEGRRDNASCTAWMVAAATVFLRKMGEP